VENGGLLVLGPISGYHFEYWAAYMHHALGKMGKRMDIDVESRLPIDLNNDNYDVAPEGLFNTQGKTQNHKYGLWSEALSSGNGEERDAYKNGLHNGKTAIIENKVGKGKVVFLGTDPESEVMEQLMLKYAGEQAIQTMALGHKDILVVPRKGKSGEYKFIINLQNYVQKIGLFTDVEDQLNGKRFMAGIVELKPFQLILSKEF